MAKKEAGTDLWVYDLLRQANVRLEPQGSSIREVSEALKTASKRGTGNAGRPEYVGAVKDFLLVIEDKADMHKHIRLDDGGAITLEPADTVDYAVNGALLYARHLAKNTSFKKIIAFGVSGSERRHRITPLFVDGDGQYSILEDVESFISFNEENIDEYYVRMVLKEATDAEKETAEILRDAAALHEDLRNYGNLRETEKPLIVSGILFALRESEFRNFSIDDLTGDAVKTDGQKIYDAISASLSRVNVSPDVKKEKILSRFSFIKDTVKLNEPDPHLGKTPLRHFAEYLNERIYRSIRYIESSEDYVGRFYGEFMSYSGGDGQSLGIILTPKHITRLFCELADLNASDVVFDPCCGTAGFLIAAMYSMLKKAETPEQRKSVRQRQLHGIELNADMFTIATTNMILRGDGKSNLTNEDFLRKDAARLQLNQYTVGMINPPYSQGSRQNTELYELSFVLHLLNSLARGARCVAILPQSSMTGKTREEQELKESILKGHTLEGVITLNKDTFYGVGVMPCIAVFAAGEPHPKGKACKFVNFEDDGYRVFPHVGLMETEAAKDKREHLLDVWFGRMEAEARFCIKTAVEPSDEWLHSFYYFNDELPSDADFDKAIGDYLTFEFSMVMQGREYLFDDDGGDGDGDGGSGGPSGADSPVGREGDAPPAQGAPSSQATSDLEGADWRAFFINEVFTIIGRGKRLKREDHTPGKMPYVSSSALNNGVDGFVSNTANVRIFSNCISLANSGSVGASFYEPFSFVASDHVTQLKNEQFGKYHYLFIAAMLRRLSEKYNFNREINDKRISREKVLLPAKSDGSPDYVFMESYAKEREAALLQRARPYLLKALETCKGQPAGKPACWKAFFIGDLCDIESGINISEPERIPGDTPYITAKSVGNGISCFVQNKNASLEANCISVNSNGSVGYAFYHKYPALYSNDCRKLRLKEHNNEFVALFIANQIMMQKEKYNYSIKMGTRRLLRQRIMLPAKSDGGPDYAFMESYAKEREAALLQRYADSKLAALGLRKRRLL